MVKDLADIYRLTPDRPRAASRASPRRASRTWSPRSRPARRRGSTGSCSRSASSTWATRWRGCSRTTTARSRACMDAERRGPAGHPRHRARGGRERASLLRLGAQPQGDRAAAEGGRAARRRGAPERPAPARRRDHGVHRRAREHAAARRAAARRARGARIAGGISRKVTLVVAGPGAGSKLEDATRLGVAVIDEARVPAPGRRDRP